MAVQADTPTVEAAPAKDSQRAANRLVVAGLFAGIGGIEVGLAQAGHHAALLCELDVGARVVLTKNLQTDQRGITVVPEVRDVRPCHLDGADLISAGFPCQDLSQAGRTAGIRGSNSGLVGEVFRLLDEWKPGPRWLLLENVPFMLHLQRGRAMRYLTEALEERGFTWAYRMVDTRSFGLPHRRQRILLLASRTEDPRDVLFSEDAGEPLPIDWRGRACGFYWTEGLRGLGWAVDAVPTLKGGSTIGIPSPPGIWMPNGEIVTPDIRDAERLQGFPADWTLPAVPLASSRKGPRWKLIGNAVSVPVAAWIGRHLAAPGLHDVAREAPLALGASWPTAAWGRPGHVPRRVDISTWPVRVQPKSLEKFLEFPRYPLSERAAAGFLARARSSSLRFVEGFLDDIATHVDRMRDGNIPLFTEVAVA